MAIGEAKQLINPSTGVLMARKATINLDSLTALGAEKLARLVLDASARDGAFKRFVVAALAGAKGPKAVAAVIDRKIGAIARAKGFVEWDRAKTFAADLDMTVKAIVDELGPADPLLAIERLLRFIATHQAVFERIDDSQGRVQGIYETAIDALRPLVASVPDAEREPLPDMIMAALGRETHGYLPMVVSAVAADIPPAALAGGTRNWLLGGRRFLARATAVAVGLARRAYRGRSPLDRRSPRPGAISTASSP